MKRSLIFLRLPRTGGAPPERRTDGGDLSEDQVRRLIAREGHGDTRRAIKVLARENASLREERRLLKEQVEKAKTENRLAPDGGIALNADEAKRWVTLSKHLTESKLTPEQLIEAATEKGKLEGELASVKRRELHTEVAASLGWNGAALGDVLDLKKLDVAMRDVSMMEDGKKVTRKIAHVRPVGDEKAPWEALEDFAESNLKTFLPSLTATEDEETDEAIEGEPDELAERRRATSKAAQNGRSQGGTPFPAQRKTKTPAPGTKTDEDLRKEAVTSSQTSQLYGSL